MTFSARSLAVSPSAVAAVPLIGPDVTTPPSTRRNSSGDAETTQTGSSDAPTGTCTPRRTAPGCRRRARPPARGRRAPREAARTARGRDSPGRRRLRGCGDRTASTAVMYVSRSSDDVHARASGPRHGAVAPTCAGRTVANRQARTRPSKSPTTAHQPAVSRSGSARTSTTSTRSVASTPANQALPGARTDRSGTRTRYRHRQIPQIRSVMRLP